jgi:uncharacterized protein (DUF427 family)
MTLMLGSAPFGQRPGGVWNFDAPGADGGVIYFEALARRVRGVFAGETVVDSRRARLLHESRYLAKWYFPLEDVRTDLLEQSDRTTRCPFKGEASYWSLRVGDRVAPDVAWGYVDPIASAGWLAGYVSFEFDDIDAWYEEDEQVFGHPRDPYSRIDVLDSSREVRVSLDGVTLASTSRARALHETGLPPRWYIPRADVAMDLLEPSEVTARCAYKGLSSFWSARVGDRVEEVLAWTYPDPNHDALRVRDYVCFFNERVDLELDGELEPRPRTPWSDASWAEGPQRTGGAKQF